MEKWKYRAIHIYSTQVDQSETQLNALGDDGWELVSVAVTPHGGSGPGSGGGTSTAYLKKRAEH